MLKLQNLTARIETEKELLIQLADAGLSNDSRIPLANIKKFDEAYLINLINANKIKELLIMNIRMVCLNIWKLKIEN